MDSNDWESRILCDDDCCIGVIGPNGKCNECGRVSIKYSEKRGKVLIEELSRENEKQDWERRTPCIDGNCIGVIGIDGRCTECGKEFVYDKSDGYKAPYGNEFGERTLCDDDCCIGIIGPDGRCSECGKSSTTYRQTEEFDSSGFIYILINPSLRKNFLKIGKTTRSPKERAINISQGTGIPTKYHVAYQTHVTNCEMAERMIHQRLKYCRVRKSREFFEIPLEKAIQAIEEVKSKIERNSENEDH